ncbi:MAG TPA: protein kinase [Kofleriaceae bacterium]|jgi:TolB-like protein/tRNA A-37 threonylcarbamoyl transferase component Bud32/Tfp pilus assembly protein PilF|nr:protein kinase [Kofleriaceae bacterium]
MVPKGSDDEVAPTLFPVATPPGLEPTAAYDSSDTGPVLRSKIGPYVIDGVIGAGGMGVVYGARDPKLDRKVAIKVLRPRENDSSEYQRLRLLREARAMAKLSHPNVVTVFGADVDAEEIYFAMELVDGTTLRQWLSKTRTWQEIVRVLIGAGRGLAAAHAVGLVHRDFKPDNVLIDANERARVSDFGIASETSTPQAVHAVGLAQTIAQGSQPVENTRQGQLVGTPRYMSPEQYGTAAVDARSDQYSFCLVLYEALFNAHPFEFTTLEELISRIMRGERAPIPSSNVPEWIHRVIDRGLARDAGDRFPSMTALVDELERNLRVGSLPIPDKPSIAVLPFHNLSDNPAQEHFADGVVESITSVLSRIRSFFVISRNSAFQFRGRDRNPREIGRNLGVAYLLDGSVQRVGSRVRITVQLIEAASGVQLWADKYDGTLDEVFDLQDRITEHVAGALQPSIRHAEIERARRKRPVELGAYDYTMRAMHHVWHLEKAEAAQGLQLLESALELDPNYPLAVALKAWCLAQHSVYNWVDNATSVLERAVQLADTAANMSADDPVVLTVLGTVHTFARNHGVARVMLSRAVMLDPNNAWALSRLGWLDVYADQPEAAATHFERALRLSPFDPMNFNNYVGLASSKQVAGDDNAAADLFLRALQERPQAAWIHRNLAPALYGAGRQTEAFASRDAMLAAYPELTVRKYKAVMVFSPRVLARIADQLRALGVPDGES